MKGMIMLMNYFYRMNTRRTAAKYMFLGIALGSVATALVIKYMDSLNEAIVENLLGQEDGEIDLFSSTKEDDYLKDDDGYIIITPKDEAPESQL